MLRYLRLLGIQLRASTAVAMQYRVDFLVQGSLTLTLVLLLTGTFRNILTYAGVGLSVSAFFVVLAVVVLRIRRPGLPRPFHTPAYPITPLVFLACTAWIIVFAFREQPLWSAVSLLVIASGIPVYYIWHGRTMREKR